MAAVSVADPTAVVGRRVIAAIIDWSLLLAVAVALFSTQLEYLDVDQLDAPSGADYCERFMDEVNGVCIDAEDIDGRVYFTDGSGDDQALGLVPLGLAFLIHVVLQGLTGATPGKAITGLRTVAEDGGRPGIGRALVRWLLLIVDAQPCGLPLVGFITALTTTGHRRVGDMAAKTFVVRAKDAGRVLMVPGITAAPTPAGAWQPAGVDYTTPGGPTAPWPDPAPGAATPPPGAAPGTPPAASQFPSNALAPPPPQWDEARGTYIQWDPSQQAWFQWDDATKVWNRIAGQ